MDHSNPSVCGILYRFLIILSKIYSNKLYSWQVSELPLSEFSGSTPRTMFVTWWHYCKHQGEYTWYHYGISVIKALPSLLQMSLVGWRDSCICRLVPSLQNSNFKCHHATFLPTNGCWKSNHIPFLQLTNKNSAPIFWKVFTPRWLLQSQPCFYRCSICEWQNNQNHRVKTSH